MARNVPNTSHELESTINDFLAKTNSTLKNYNEADIMITYILQMMILRPTGCVSIACSNSQTSK